MSLQRESRREHWDRFWRARPVTEVYEAVGCLPDELARHRDPRGLKVLEVGAGSGRDSVALARQGADVTVLDYSTAALESVGRSAAAAGVAIRRLRGDAFALPLADASFDIVFHQGLLEHFRQPEGIVAENARVLKPGGILLADVPQRWHYYTPAKHLLIALGRWFAGWERSFSIRELEGLLLGQNLDLIRSYGSWAEPCLPYRALRRLLGLIGLSLPPFPRPLPLVGPLAAAIRRKIRYRRLGQYTAMVIGAVAEKPAAQQKGSVDR